jgi:hypothetical protein
MDLDGAEKTPIRKSKKYRCRTYTPSRHFKFHQLHSAFRVLPLPRSPLFKEAPRRRPWATYELLQADLLPNGDIASSALAVGMSAR